MFYSLFLTQKHSSLLVKKSNCVGFTSVSWDEFLTSKVNCHKQEDILISWCHVRTIKSIHKNLRTKLPELLASYYWCVWSGVVLIEHNFSFIDQSWPFLSDCCVQTVQLLKAKLQIKSMTVGKQLIVDDFLPILPNILYKITWLAFLTLSKKNCNIKHFRFAVVQLWRVLKHYWA